MIPTIIAALVLLAAQAVSGSLVLNQAVVRVGDPMTFTATYPQDAAKSAHNTDFHDQPNIQIDCSISGALSFHAIGYMADKQKITGGWMSQTYPIVLGGFAGQSCNAALYYFTFESGVPTLHVIAGVSFEVVQ